MVSSVFLKGHIDTLLYFSDNPAGVARFGRGIARDRPPEGAVRWRLT